VRRWDAVRVVTFKVDEDLFWRIEALARMKGVTRSDVIREALMLYLAVEERRTGYQPRIVRLSC